MNLRPRPMNRGHYPSHMSTTEKQSPHFLVPHQWPCYVPLIMNEIIEINMINYHSGAFDMDTIRR